MVSKVHKKNEKKKTSVPVTLQEVFEQRTRNHSPNQGLPSTTTNRKPSPPARRKKSPPMPFQGKKSQDNLIDGNVARNNQPAPPLSGPPPPPPPKPSGNMSYAQLNFSLGGGGEFVDDERLSSGPKASSGDPLPHVRGGGRKEEGGPAVTTIPYDPKTKFDYSTILFDESKRKDIIAAERLKKERGAPPPPVPNKYQGEGKKVKKLRPYASDSNTAVCLSTPQSKELKFQGKARPISAGANRTPAASGLGTRNGVNPVPNNSSNGDYEVIDSEFWDAEEGEEFENVPQKPRSANASSANGRVLVGSGYSMQPPPITDRQASSSSGYENVALDMNEGNGQWGRQNQPLPPLPSREQSSRPQQLIKSVQLNGGGPPLPKPRLIVVVHVYIHTHVQLL